MLSSEYEYDDFVATESEEEAVVEWLLTGGESIDAEGAMDWLKSVAPAALAGATTGAAAGPLGALVGGALGAGLGAIQTAQKPAGTRRPARPRALPVAAKAPAAAPAPSPTQAPSGALVQQLGQLLPLLTQLLAQRQQPSRPAEVVGEMAEAGETADGVPFGVSESSGEPGHSSQAILDAHRGIEWPVPDDIDWQGDTEALFENHPSPEYPQASRLVPALRTNYRRWDHPSPRPIRRIIIHITDGGPKIEGPINWFRNPGSKVSAHYVVGRDGEVVQMVFHNDVAWHARGANSDSIGIEHVANTKGLSPTPAQYANSAALVRWLCERYSIPMDRAHILGHSEAVPGTTHTGCPNAVWDWDYYMSMVQRAVSLPRESEEGAALAENCSSFEEDAYDWVSEGEGDPCTLEEYS